MLLTPRFWAHLDDPGGSEHSVKTQKGHKTLSSRGVTSPEDISPGGFPAPPGDISAGTHGKLAHFEAPVVQKVLGIAGWGSLRAEDVPQVTAQ